MPRRLPLALAVGLLTLAVPPLAGAEEPAPGLEPDTLDKRAIERPGEASQRARETPVNSPTSGAAYGGGIWMVDQAPDGLSEPLPRATSAELMRQGYEIRDGHTMVAPPQHVDEAGSLYSRRRYHGVVPGIHAMFSAAEMARLRGRDLVSWTGFQPLPDVSRLFWQLTADRPAFEVRRVDARTLHLILPKTRLRRHNDGRRLDMTGFPTPVARVISKRRGKGRVFVVELKEDANYLYRYEAPFLFLDVEHPGAPKAAVPPPAAATATSPAPAAASPAGSGQAHPSAAVPVEAPVNPPASSGTSDDRWGH